MLGKGGRATTAAEVYSPGVRHDPTAMRGDFDSLSPASARGVLPENPNLAPSRQGTPYRPDSGLEGRGLGRHSPTTAPDHGLPDGFDDLNRELGDLNVQAPGNPASPLATLLKPRLSAPETGAMFKGRQKLAGAVPEGVSLPPGASDELDRMGVEYGRTQSSLKRLLGMPDADPAEIAQTKQAARELGQRLRARKNELTAPTGRTVNEPPSMANDGPLAEGFTDTEGLAAHLAGRKDRWTLPDDATPVSDRHFDRVAGNTSGRVERRYGKVAGTGPTPGRRAGDIKAAPETRQNITSEMDALDAATPGPRPVPKLWDGDETSMGSGGGNLLGKLLKEPADALSAGAGAGAGYVFSDEGDEGRDMLAGAALGLGGRKAYQNPAGLERWTTASMLSSPLTLAKIVLGNTGGSMIRAGQKAIEDGDPSIIGRTAKEMFSGKTVDAVKDAFTSGRLPDRLDGTGYATSGPLSVPGRAIGALDTGFKDAMGRAGFGADEAADVALTSEPKNGVLHDFLNFQRKHAAARIPFPFAKTQAGMIEQGFVEPTKSLGRLLKGESGGFGRGEGGRKDLVKAGTAAALGAGGYAAADELPTWAEPFAVAAAGPFAAPAAVGAMMSHMPDNPEPVDYLTNAARGVSQQLPLAGENDFDPRALISRLVPNALRDVAKLTDPHERETPGLFGKAIAKVPGMRDTLPQKRRRKRRRE
jgi:hypothetical protein